MSRVYGNSVARRGLTKTVPGGRESKEGVGMEMILGGSVEDVNWRALYVDVAPISPLAEEAGEEVVEGLLVAMLCGLYLWARKGVVGFGTLNAFGAFG